MNVVRRGCVVALVTGLGWWLARYAAPSTPEPLPAAARPPAAASAGITPRSLPPVPDAPAAPVPAFDERAAIARLLANVAALSAEFDRLRAQSDDIERFRRGAGLENEFAALLDADPETAALLVREMPAGFVDSHFGVIALYKWAGEDRAAAAGWMALHPGATAASAEALARGWFAADPVGIATHLDQLSHGAWRDNLSVTAAEDAFLAQKPGTVLALLDHAATDNARRVQLAEWTATAWARQDTEAAAAWAAGEADPTRRQKLFAAVAIGQANTDPAAASARLLRTVTDTAALEPAIRSVVTLWAPRDATAAATWISQLPDGPLRQAGEDALLAVASR